MKLIKIGSRIALVIVAIVLLTKHAESQFVNNGSSITIAAGAVLHTDSSFTNTANGSVVNNGTINAGGNIINDPGSILSGDGMYSMQGNFTNTGTYSAGMSVLDFFGSVNSYIKNASGDIYILQVHKDSGKVVALNDHQKVIKSVSFLNQYNYIQLTSRNLTLDINANIVSGSKIRFFITNGTGSLKKLNVKNTPFIFPVGFNKSTYNPVTITEQGTPDEYSVRCFQHALLEGTSGNPISTKGIDASWEIKQGVAGGANAVIEATWKTTDELPNFDHTECILVRYATNDWDYNVAQASTATGSPYRTITRSGLNTLGVFTVLSDENPTFSAFAKAAPKSIFAGGTQFKIYPTIVQSNINIEVQLGNKSSGKMNISIIDESGKTVWQKQNADFATQRIFLPNLTAGMYNVLIEFDNERFVQKIIVER